MQFRTLERYLSEHPFFLGMEPAYLTVLTECAKNMRFKPGELMIQHRQPANFFYIIRHGMAAIEIPFPEEEAIRIQTMQDGEVVGWSWMVSPYASFFDVRVLQPTQALGLDGRCLRAKCAQDHKLGYALYKRFTAVIIERLQATLLQAMDIYGEPHVLENK